MKDFFLQINTHSFNTTLGDPNFKNENIKILIVEIESIPFSILVKGENQNIFM